MHLLRISNRMRWRGAAIVSLAANVLLAIGWLFSSHTQSDVPADKTAQGPAQNSKTNFVVRRQGFSWHQIESPDYPTYIVNLRDIGCPEQTIRDIIIADVNSLYSLKRATNLVTSEQEWWKSEPDPKVAAEASQKSRALEEERKALLGRLLGTNWEAGDVVSLPRPSRPGIILDGPMLGTLPAETKLAIQEI